MCLELAPLGATISFRRFNVLNISSHKCLLHTDILLTPFESETWLLQISSGIYGIAKRVGSKTLDSITTNQIELAIATIIHE